MAFPLGWLSDRLDRRVAIGLGVLCLIGSMLCFGLVTTSWIAALGVVLYGFHFGTQGALMALFSSTMQPKITRHGI